MQSGKCIYLVIVTSLPVLILSFDIEQKSTANETFPLNTNLSQKVVDEWHYPQCTWVSLSKEKQHHVS